MPGRVRRLRPLAALTCWSIAPLALASVQLQVRGVDEPLAQAITASVELSQYTQREASAAQVQRMAERAPAQAEKALEPFGYYAAHATAQVEPAGKDWKVTLTVVPGAPVMVTTVEVQLDPAALALPPIRRAHRAITRLAGQRLDAAQYDAARDAMSAALTANGYLDARLVTRRVAVYSAAHRAEIHLAWQVGPRFRYGRVEFDHSPFHPGFLDRYVPFKPGDYFNQDQLLQLQQALNGADYFAVANVVPNINPQVPGTVDIAVELKPARRTVYTGGPFIGTDTGYGFRARMERRYVNRRGDKWKNELVAAQRLKTLSTTYTIPLPGDHQRSWNIGANYRDANTATSQSRTFELVGNETRRWRGWTRTLGVHVLSGTFTVGKRGNEPDTTPGIERGTSTLTFFEASLTRKQADDFAFVREGWSLALAARSTAGNALSSASFSDVTADAKWIHAFGAKRRNRLIVRSSAGHTWTDDFAALPPQLRFFAGGDRSVRGYSYQSIGPRNHADRVMGGVNLLVGSAEVEHYFTRNWGIAAFVDAGNAFDGFDYRPKVGTGLGLRWRSPVGLIRVDLGTPIHDRNRHGVELHIVIGPDL